MKKFKKKQQLHFQVYKEDFDQMKQEMKREGGCLFSNLAYSTLKYKHYQICDRKIEITDLNIFLRLLKCSVCLCARSNEIILSSGF